MFASASIRKFKKEGVRWVIEFDESTAQTRADSIRLLKEQGCTWFKHSERYDIQTDVAYLETIGQ